MMARIAALLLLITTSLVTANAQAAPVCYSLPFSNPNLGDGFGSTCCGRSNPHRGVDFPQAAGTAVPAVADGTVVVKTYSGCLGNVVVLRHADGMYSGYAHLLEPASVNVGQSVSKGGRVGRVGSTGTCSTGPHLHLTMSNHEAGWGSGSVVDPYQYIQAHKTCRPACVNSAGPFTFSCAGPEDGQVCVHLDEPEDENTWDDNYLCTKNDLGVLYSNAGAIDELDCTQIAEPGEVNDGWDDNFLCVPDDFAWDVSWSHEGALDGACVRWEEPRGGETWADNFLCTQTRHEFEAGGFSFSNAGPVDGKHCISVDEPADPDTWSDNYLCAGYDVGLQWSTAGPIEGLTCTQIVEPSDPDGWDDNYLCLPDDAPYRLTWSYAGRLDDAGACVRWYEASDPNTWTDNYLCVATLGGGPLPADPPRFDDSVVDVDVDGDAPSASGDERPTIDDIAMDGACGCTVATDRPARGLALALLLLAAVAVGFRRGTSRAR